MKKTIVILGFLLTAIGSANAQIEAGKISVGGVLNVTSNSNKFKDGSSTNDGDKSSRFTLGPQVGYFISDGISIGAGLTYQRSVSTSAVGDIKTIGSNFYFSPFGRYHIPMGEKFYAFGEAKLNFGFGSRKRKDDGNTNKISDISTLGIALSPGVIFFPSERVGIELAFNLISFDRTADKNPDDSDNKTIHNDFSFGPNLFSPSLGVQLYF
jgi:outer membrane protein W